VTSNINRFVKTKHKEEYDKWISQLNDAEKIHQLKISDVFFTQNISMKKKRNIKSVYDDGHPR